MQSYKVFLILMLAISPLFGMDTEKALGRVRGNSKTVAVEICLLVDGAVGTPPKTPLEETQAGCFDFDFERAELEELCEQEVEEIPTSENELGIFFENIERQDTPSKKIAQQRPVKQSEADKCPNWRLAQKNRGEKKVSLADKDQNWRIKKPQHIAIEQHPTDLSYKKPLPKKAYTTYTPQHQPSHSTSDTALVVIATTATLHPKFRSNNPFAALPEVQG